MIYPEYKPQLERAAVEAAVRSMGVDDELVLFASRGYYLKMGQAGANDRRLYDDAVFLLTPSLFASWNFNTDPNGYKEGIATLYPGVWKYKIGIHGLSKPKSQQYKALVQAGPVTVTRDGRGLDSGWFGINIHRGGQNSTSSLGCQTVYAPQWQDFILCVEAWMKKSKVDVIRYVLMEETHRRTLKF